jgi:hypothetical protein
MGKTDKSLAQSSQMWWPAPFSRRDLLRVGMSGLGGLAVSRNGQAVPPAAESALAVFELPMGSAPPPLTSDHFPTRVHELVWRNWQLVPVERLAAVAGTAVAEIERIGRALGLGAPPQISAERVERSFITIMHHNWHLLPYSQLLELLGWSKARLAVTLLEDTFLFHKFGALKPDCQPVRHRPADEEIRRREAVIAAIVRTEFPDLASPPREDLFDFVAALSRAPEAPAPRPAARPLRLCHSPFASYGDPFLDGGPDPCPDGLMERLAAAGVNGLWLHAILPLLAGCPWVPERAGPHERRLANLRSLVARAKRHGLDVFLWLNEPRALPTAFFRERPDLRGVEERELAALCTSVAEVQDFLRDSVASVCRGVPDLGGFLTITASENLTNCWSHGNGRDCPRCAGREPAAVVAEVNALFKEGIRRAGSSARLIVWDWGWDDAWAEDAIRRLPEGVTFETVSEWGLPIERGGVKSKVGEYSISAVGPSERAVRRWKLARDRGLGTLAKIQAGNTWELAAVPAIPAVQSVAAHAANLRAAGVEDVMLSWTLGGFPSPNLDVVGEALASGSVDDALDRVAARWFGPVLADAVVASWRMFSAAFAEYPFHIHVAYFGPQHFGPANLPYPRPTGYKATMLGFPYDDVNMWRKMYPAATFAAQFEKMADGFRAAVESLRAASAAAEGVAEEHRTALDRECGVAEAAEIHFQSTANQARFVAARDAARAAGDDAWTGEPGREARKLLEAEIVLAKRLFTLQRADSRIGFEAQNQYFYVPLDLVEKVVACRYVLDRNSATGPRE